MSDPWDEFHHRLRYVEEKVYSPNSAPTVPIYDAEIDNRVTQIMLYYAKYALYPIIPDHDYLFEFYVVQNDGTPNSAYVDWYVDGIFQATINQQYFIYNSDSDNSYIGRWLCGFMGNPVDTDDHYYSWNHRIGLTRGGTDYCDISTANTGFVDPTKWDRGAGTPSSLSPEGVTTTLDGHNAISWTKNDPSWITGLSRPQPSSISTWYSVNFRIPQALFDLVDGGGASQFRMEIRNTGSTAISMQFRKDSPITP